MEPDQHHPPDSATDIAAAPTDGTGAVDERSGTPIAEAVARAEEDRPPAQVHQPPEESAVGSAPVERHADDPAMTEGRSASAGEASGRAMPEPPQHSDPPGAA